MIQSSMLILTCMFIYLSYQKVVLSKKKRLGLLEEGKEFDNLFYITFAVFSVGHILMPQFISLDKAIWFYLGYCVIGYFLHKKTGKPYSKFGLVFVSIFLFVKSFIFNFYYTPTESMLPTVQIGRSAPLGVDKTAYGLSFFDTGLLYQWKEPERGDVILFSHKIEESTVPYIKRVIGVSGDVVFYDFENKTYTVIPKNEKAQTIESEFTGQVYADGLEYRNEKFAGKQYHVLHDRNVIFHGTEISENGEKAILGTYRNLSVPKIKRYDVKEGEMFVLGDNRDWSGDSRFFGAVSQSKLIGKMVYHPSEVPEPNKLPKNHKILPQR